MKKFDVDTVVSYDKVGKGSYKLLFTDGSEKVFELDGKEAVGLAATFRHRAKKNSEVQKTEVQSAASLVQETPAIDAALSEEDDQKVNPMIFYSGNQLDLIPSNPNIELFGSSDNEIESRLLMGYEIAYPHDVQNYGNIKMQVGLGRSPQSPVRIGDLTILKISKDRQKAIKEHQDSLIMKTEDIPGVRNANNIRRY